MTVPAYRVTPDDLPDADKKTKRALEPLLDALNQTLTLLVTTANALSQPTMKATSFTTASNGAAYVSLGLASVPTDLWVTGLTPSDGSTLDSVYSVAWIPINQGAQLLLQGLAPLTTYNLRVRYM